MEIKDIIRNKRIERGYTMKELANLVGVSEATVSRWESGHLATMKHTKIAILAEALGISPAELFTKAPVTPTPSLTLTDEEKTLVTKYRLLAPDNKTAIDKQIDFMLYEQELEAKKQSCAQHNKKRQGRTDAAKIVVCEAIGR